jgi:diaminopimelate epimerase
MGTPSFVRQMIPMSGEPGVRVLDEQLAIPGTRAVLTMTCLNLGNPHCVIFRDAPPTTALLEELGPSIERHRVFPSRINASFAHITGPEEIVLRVWERGSGPTLACGTGAAATVAAAIETGRIPGPRATVHLPGGDLTIEWDPARDDQVYMTGPAREVFRGELTGR